MQAPVIGRRGTLLWRIAVVAFLPLLSFAGCNKSPTTAGGSLPEKGAMGGWLDGVTAEVIGGWAWDGNKPDSPVEVDIFDGDKKLATVVADVFREDLLKEKIGNGKHGFTYPTPGSLKDGKTHTIRARIAGTDTELTGSPKTFKSR
jgi:hypothetical protein